MTLKIEKKKNKTSKIKFQHTFRSPKIKIKLNFFFCKMLLTKSIALIVMCFSISKSGANIVEELRERINHVTDECLDAENKTQPAYMCSGVLLRGIHLREGMEFAWSLNPVDTAKKSFSFAYLRRDVKFKKMINNYKAGFILYPHLKTPPHKSKQRVLCSYPDNAVSGLREDRGCGRQMPPFDETGVSRPCHTQNITTASQWLKHFNSNRNNSVYMCGFSMMEETAARDFATCLHVQTLLRNGSIWMNNELLVEAWDESNVKSLPIEAFFYFVGFENGYETAIEYRDAFYVHSDGEHLPIVGIKLPSHKDEDIPINF